MDESVKRLMEVAKRIRAWQTERQLSDAQLLKRYRGLGTDRTFGRIMGGDFEELDVQRWAAEYEAVWQCIELEAEATTPAEPLYDDLSSVVEVRRAVAEAMREQGTNRLVLVQGVTGSGKTSTARLLQAKYGARVVYVEADETWKESLGSMLKGILAAVGVEAPPPAASDMLVQVCKHLSERGRICLIIDEGHHLGPRTLNLCKTILNRTPGEIVLFTMGTLWRRLESAAFEEARQLSQNRLCERIRCEAIPACDVALIVQRRLGISGADAKRAGEVIADAANKVGGGLTVVKLICRRALKLAGGKDVALETVGKAIQQVISTR